eukprot:5020894-Prymnesium_polylepis.1
MNAAGIGSTTLVVNKAAVTSGTITEAEYTALMDTSSRRCLQTSSIPAHWGASATAPSCPWRPPPPWCAPLGALQRRW